MIRQEGLDEIRHLAQGGRVKEQTVNGASYPLNTLSILSYLIPDAADSERTHIQAYFLAWPPNLFAATSMIFEVTGCYSLVTSHACFPSGEPERKEWRATVARLATNWRSRLAMAESKSAFGFLNDPNQSCDVARAQWEAAVTYTPNEVREYWNAFSRTMDPPRLGNTQDLWRDDHNNWVRNLLLLHAVADATCAGWGIRPLHGHPSVAAVQAMDLLQKYGTMATIHPDRARVLPKRHTPQVGITLRSLSRCLSFHRSSIDVAWHTAGRSILDEQTEPSRPSGQSPCKTIEVLLFPWPRTIAATQFVGECIDRKQRRGLFSYHPRSSAAEALEVNRLCHRLRLAIASAKQEVGRVDMVIMPELAVLKVELDDLGRVLDEAEIPVCITGVLMPSERGTENDNAVCAYVLDEHSKRVPMYQSKHHRWNLNEWQIRSYQLGSRLHPKYRWAENLVVRRLQARFINLGSELTLCPLVCEDLARQGQLAELLRAVGPSLVVAVLMDGPQIPTRWAARYANILGDDPGSAVITLTSLGMVRRYRPPKLDRDQRSRTIALWSDRSGLSTEIELDEDSEAVVLSLAVDQVREATIDGREGIEIADDDESPPGTFTLTLGGVNQIRIDCENDGTR